MCWFPVEFVNLTSKIYVAIHTYGQIFVSTYENIVLKLATFTNGINYVKWKYLLINKMMNVWKTSTLIWCKQKSIYT